MDSNMSLFDQSLKDFFDVYVPFDGQLVGCRPWSDPAAVFADVPFSEPETERCSKLIEALESIVGDFEPERKPHFADSSRCDASGDEKWGHTWRDISMVFEIEQEKHKDPFGDYGPQNYNSATSGLIQVAKSARNIMLTHGMLFVYVVGIYDTMARSTGSIMQRESHPDPGDEEHKSREPSHGGREASVPMDDGDQYNEDGSELGAVRYLLYRLRDLNPRLFSRSTTVWDALEEGTWQFCAIKEAWRQLAHDREDVLYNHLREAYRNRPWWEMVEDHVFMHCNDEPGPGKPLLPDGFQLDDAGCPILTEKLEEMVVAASLDIGVTELYGLPDVAYGEDLGAREAAKVLSSLRSSRSSTFEVSDADLDLLASSADRPPAYEAYHRTVCGWLMSAEEATYNERSHMRLVMRTVGRPLSDFRSTKELVRALRDAIHGHRQAYRAGMIHRDISEGNVMIVDDGMCSFVGFLLDLDYAFDWKAALRHAGWPVNEARWKEFVNAYNENPPDPHRPVPPETHTPVFGPGAKDNIGQDNEFDQAKLQVKMKLRERIGTLDFMAIEILETYLVHDVHHDLESFFWLLLWIVLRHTNHTNHSSHVIYLEIFNAQDDKNSAQKKKYFLTESMEWEVKDNKPLTTLIYDFKDLCLDNVPTRGDRGSATISLTYESVLAVFDKALADPSWPENDSALPFKLPRDASNSQSGQNESAESRQDEKRTRGADDMDRIEEKVDNDDPFGMRKRALGKKSQVDG
ncbi:uncharacterized protein B0H18DRAFT_1117183 [Fomitopsis serialis]|uniref:uncharacterized protein n=1 Tax=Fomitopsis serialis TaxID=139415 RepID=UPI0020088B22|nr:uncharacterized protein B0H18DRAFT_1117183 [Neoantrodia serialis]KAH9930130.1 hypothetical protein B0H18DRAFT_1117183 [Neoantrodia serialis]